MIYSPSPADGAPLISVIVPIYNVAAYIGPCIASLRGQTLANFEVILVDDGSTDGSGDCAIAAFADDPRFRLISQKNQGLSGARNTGLDQVRGDFVAFVDSDDRVMPDYLMRLWQALEDSQCDWVACAIRSCYPDGSGNTHAAIHGAANLTAHPSPRRYALQNWPDIIRHFPSAWNKLYRRPLIEGLRFDENTWFEDHGFFYRVAARTDHILHLPEALYLQTRGRDGQITTSDDDRVFDQFDVLRQMRRIMQASPHSAKDAGFAQITSRLLFERSTALQNAERRSRFARLSVEFLQEQNLKYTADLAAGVGQSWALEMQGVLPVSIVIPWDGEDGAAPDLLRNSLMSLVAQIGLGYEALIVCDSVDATNLATALIADTPALHGAAMRVLQQSGHGSGPARNHGLDAAVGHYVVFLDAGDTLHSGTLHHWVETMLHSEADFGLSQFNIGTGAQLALHNGFHDMRILSGETPPDGEIDITAMLALTLEAHPSSKIFRREFLREHGLKFTDAARPEWALCLGAALLARRAYYFAHAGLEIADSPAARRQWHAPSSARALIRGHNAMLRALPITAQTLLPTGWQRRLFARALWEQVHFGTYSGRVPKYLMLAGATLAAPLRGLGKLDGRSQQHPAGLDPFIGPRLTKLLSPSQFLRPTSAHSLPPQASLTEATSDHISKTTPRTRTMVLFPLHKHGLLRFRADFKTAPFANISFFAPDGVTIPFHLSLRFDEGVAVCNNFQAGGTWGGEHSRVINLPRQGLNVVIEFSQSRVKVWLDGQELFCFGGRINLRRNPFKGLENIASFETQGEITPLEIIPQVPDVALMLDPRLLLRGTGAAGEHKITAQPSGQNLATIPALTTNNSPNMLAILPARLWLDCPPDAPLTFQLTHANETTIAPVLKISRPEMTARIETILTTLPSNTDATLILTVLEHIKYAALLNQLSPNAQRQAHSLAMFYGLGDFLASATEITAQNAAKPARLATPASAPTDELDIAVTQFAHSQRQSNPPDPLIVLENLALPLDQQSELFLTLCEFFCMQGQDFDGFAALANKRGLPPFKVGNDLWANSATLPFLFVQGDFDDLLEVLKSFATPNEQWLVTPALAWVARQTLSAQHLPEKTRVDILNAFMQIILRRAALYWERSQCRELVQTAVALLLGRDQTPDQMQHDIIDFCLRSYGLSRQFWQILEATTPSAPPLPAKIRAARSAFAVILKGADLNDPQAAAQLEQALGFFDQVRCGDTARLRREFFGPAGRLLTDTPVFAPTRLNPDADTDHEDTPATAIIRHMAFPNTAPLSQDMSMIAAHALPDLYPDLPRAPYFDLQIEVSQQIGAMLADPAKPVSADRLDRLLCHLGRLSSDGSEFIGITFGVALITGFADQTSQDETRNSIAQHLIDLCTAMAPEQQAAMRVSPALCMALLTLKGSNAPEAAPLMEALAATSLPVSSATDNAGLPTGAPLFDTIVTVFSCKPYLETRIPALRSGWLSLLKALGIPYVIIVGDGDGERRGDVVHLDVPDDYEGLPQKTLGTIRWVHDNTQFSYMLKIDDDCFLNAPLFFQSLNYRKFDYYGRSLYRAAGQMDRIWHQEKSTSARGKLDLDKSSEPSTYADGGSSYTLSRTAMAAALDAADDPVGQQLIQMSFMEDKMLGDLLALRNITVQDEEYRTSIRRRTYSNAQPVPFWSNSFYPSKTAAIQQVHMDTHLGQDAAIERLGQTGLWPRKIWPTYQQVKLGYQSNTLELISSQASVQAACEAEVAVVACMRNEMFMLPHFLAHYRALGVGAFLIADNVSDDGTLEYLAKQPDVALFSVDTDYRLSHYGVAWQQALMGAFRVGKWTLAADADELLVWQETQTQTLPELLAEPEFSQADAVRLFMLDMYPKGPLEQADFTDACPFSQAAYAEQEPFLTSWHGQGPYSNMPTWTSALRHRLMPEARPNLFVAQKIALLRYQPWMRLSAGLHFVGDVHLSKRELLFAHFKYNADFRRKVQTEVARGQHFNDAEEYRKYQALISEGRSVIFDPDHSTLWSDVPFVRALLSP